MFSLPILNYRNIFALWVSFFLLLSLLYGVFIYATGLSPIPLWAISVAVIIFFLVPFRLKKLVCAIWTKVAYRVAKISRKYTVRVLYFVIFGFIRYAGSQMELKRLRSNTSWDSWEENNGSLVSEQKKTGWMTHYLSWALVPKNLWALPLLPLIVILKSLQDPSDVLPPEALLIYTLY